MYYVGIILFSLTKNSADVEFFFGNLIEIYYDSIYFK